MSLHKMSLEITFNIVPVNLEKRVLQFVTKYEFYNISDDIFSP